MPGSFTQPRFGTSVQPDAFRFFTWSRISRTTRPSLVGAKTGYDVRPAETAR
jgi:hypothetical protein